MARKERIVEDIKYRSELLKLTWATLVGVIAGTASIIFRDVPWLLVTGVGLVVTVGSGAATWHLHTAIKRRLDTLEEV